MTRLMKTLMPSLLLLVLGFTSGASAQTCSGGCGCDNEQPAEYCCDCGWRCQCGCSICRAPCENNWPCPPPAPGCQPCKCMPGEAQCNICGPRPCEQPRCTGSSSGCLCGNSNCYGTTNCGAMCPDDLSTPCGAHRSNRNEGFQGGGTADPCQCSLPGCQTGTICRVIRCNNAPPTTSWACGYPGEYFFPASCAWWLIGCMGAGCQCPGFCPSGTPECETHTLPCATGGCNGNDCGCGDYCTAFGTPCGL